MVARPGGVNSRSQGAAAGASVVARAGRGHVQQQAAGQAEGSGPALGSRAAVGALAAGMLPPAGGSLPGHVHRSGDWSRGPRARSWQPCRSGDLQVSTIGARPVSMIGARPVTKDRARSRPAVAAEACMSHPRQVRTAEAGDECRTQPWRSAARVRAGVLPSRSLRGPGWWSSRAPVGEGRERRDSGGWCPQTRTPVGQTLGTSAGGPRLGPVLAAEYAGSVCREGHGYPPSLRPPGCCR